MRGLSIPFFPFDFLTPAINLLVIAVVVMAILALFNGKIYNRLSTRITVLIFASGLVTLVIALVFNELTQDTLSPPWLRQLQIALIVLGGPIALGFLAARFVRRPLRQFNKAVSSMESNNYKVQLEPTGIREFDEVFTEFNSLIDRLQHEEKLRKDLVSDTSHELNTPLAIMIGQLTAIEEGKYRMTKERVTILKEQTERLAELVQQLDTYTKARMPDSDSSEEIDLKQFCDELTRHFSLELEQRGIKTKIDIAEDYIIHANQKALQQILTNLMQNTLRYSQATEITIEATSETLVFSDNGKGVPTKNLPHLFERFYRVDTSRNRATGGLGLGLAIVKELVEQQGWQIHAEQAYPGLAFVLTLHKK